MLTLTRVEGRESPVAFEVLFGGDPWLTPDRRAAVLAAFGQWAAAVRDEYPPLPQSGYRVHDHAGRVVADGVPPLPADTLRVWVGVGPTFTPHAAAETGPAGYVIRGDPLPRVPGWVMTFNPAVATDAALPAVALHEAGHVAGLDHQPTPTPAEWQTAMYPLADAGRTRLTGLDYRDLLWAGHDLAPGTVVTGIGVQTPGRVDGWMVYGG